MLTPDLILDHLRAPQAQQRRRAARILGLVQDTRALELIREQFAREEDPATKSALDWAGQRIHTARRSGYLTFDEIFRRYHLERAPQPNLVFASSHTPAESVRKIAFGRPPDRQNWQAWQGYGEESRNQAYRLPPKLPSKRSPQPWLARFRSQNAQKCQILQALTALNNPIALVDLSELYFEEEDKHLQEEIAETAKTIYLSFVYWDMTRRGILEEAINLRLESLHEFSPLSQYFPEG